MSGHPRHDPASSRALHRSRRLYRGRADGDGGGYRAQGQGGPSCRLSRAGRPFGHGAGLCQRAASGGCAAGLAVLAAGSAPRAAGSAFSPTTEAQHRPARPLPPGSADPAPAPARTVRRRPASPAQSPAAAASAPADIRAAPSDHARAHSAQDPVPSCRTPKVPSEAAASACG